MRSAPLHAPAARGARRNWPHVAPSARSADTLYAAPASLSGGPPPAGQDIASTIGELKADVSTLKRWCYGLGGLLFAAALFLVPYFSGRFDRIDDRSRELAGKVEMIKIDSVRHEARLDALRDSLNQGDPDRDRIRR